MNTQTLNEKLELIQWLSTLEDVSVIKKLMVFKKEETKDWWNSISEEEEKSINEGIIQADNNELKPHSEARKLYGKWL
jgi:hypothetical protein